MTNGLGGAKLDRAPVKKMNHDGPETSSGLMVGPGIDFNRSVFVMSFSQCGRTLGSIQMQPNFHFCRNFGHALGRFTLASPKKFEAKIEKVIIKKTRKDFLCKITIFFLF